MASCVRLQNMAQSEIIGNPVKRSGRMYFTSTQRSTLRAGLPRKRMGLWPRGQRASVALLVAIAAPALLLALGLGIEASGWTSAETEVQRTADMAALAGALAYNNSANPQVAATEAAYTAEINGGLGGASRTWAASSNTLSDGQVTVQMTNGIRNSADKAFVATIQTTVPLFFSAIALKATSLTLTATAYAEIKSNPPACIVALQPGGTGVTLSGGTTVNSGTCGVASNSTVSVPCGTSIVTATLDYNSAAAPSEPCGGVTPPSGTPKVDIVKMATADPLSTNAGVAAAFAQLTSVAGLTGPAQPAVPTGHDVVFGYSTSSTQAQLAGTGCTGAFASGTWTVACPPGGTYQFGAISVAGGINLQFATGGGGSPTNTYNFSGAIDLTGSAANFGPGSYTVAGGIYTGGGTTTTFSTGSYTVGAGTVSCNGASYSICNTGNSLSFGAANFAISGGIYNGGGATLNLGTGSGANSFDIGAGSAGYAIETSGGSNTSFGGMSAGTFQAAGQIATGGGSSLALGAAPAFDINGNFSLAGSATLGTGTYSVAGNIGFGNGGGGGTVSGTGVSLITSGDFSVAAGYNSVTLTGPVSGPLQNIVVAGNGAGGASFSGGASGNSLSGALYFPNAPITLSGAGNVGSGPGQCLEAIGATVTLSGGSALASPCSGLGGAGSGGTVMLVQ